MVIIGYVFVGQIIIKENCMDFYVISESQGLVYRERFQVKFLHVTISLSEVLSS